MRRSSLSSWLTPYPCQAYTRWCNHTSACAEASAEAWGSHMDRLMLDHFQWLVVILYDDMPAIGVGVEFLQTKAYQQTLSLNVCIVSLNIS